MIHDDYLAQEPRPELGETALVNVDHDDVVRRRFCRRDSGNAVLNYIFQFPCATQPNQTVSMKSPGDG